MTPVKGNTEQVCLISNCMKAIWVSLILLVIILSPAIISAKIIPNGQKSLAAIQSQNIITGYAENEFGVPVLVKGKLSQPAAVGEEIATAISFFEKNNNAFNLTSPSEELKSYRIDLDPIGYRHLRFNQHYQGLKVIGTDMIAHFDKSGVLTSVNGNLEPKIDLDINANVSSVEATSIASADLKSFFGDADAQTAELVVFPWEGQNYLAWRMFLISSTPMGRWEYFIDAHTGNVIFNANRIMNETKANDIGTGISVMNDVRTHIDTDFNGTSYVMSDKTRRITNNPHGHGGQMPSGNVIETFIAGSSLPGTIASDADNFWDVSATQSPAVDGQVYSSLIYDWMLSAFGRNSWDNNGASMRTSVNYSAEGDNNAYWNGSQIVIWSWGSGWRSLAGCPDVMAHEWAHAITETTSGMIYQKESGALNESFSDMMGIAFEFVHDSLDTPDWTMGENGRTSGTPFRSAIDPHAYNDPDFYGTSDPFWVDVVGCTPSNGNDWCGVHTNSGVGNKWFYLLSEGGLHHGVTVTGIGVENAAKVAYRANAFYWTTNIDYSNAAAASITAADDLDGSGVWAQQVQLAWDAVGVSLPSPQLVFSYPGGLPTLLTPGISVNFNVDVVATNGGSVVSNSGDLHYTINGGSLTTVSMTELLPGSYQATIPALNCNDQIEFYVSAQETTEGTFNDPNPGSPNVAAPGTIPVVVFEDDFETDKGWISENLWSRGVPIGAGGAYGNPDPTSGHDAPNLYGFNLNGDYSNNIPEYDLTSPSFDCTNLTNVSLKFWRWLGVEQPAYDHAYIRASNDGTNFVTVWENSVEITDNAWTEVEVDLSAIANNQSTVYVRFVMGTSDGGWIYCGWNIDDLQITAYSCIASGDADGDGVSDATDNCPTTANPGQEDIDSDNVGDVCDNCPNNANTSQIDADSDSFGAACDCDDTNPSINPNTIWYQDNDGDTFGNSAVTLTQCTQPVGYTLNSGDCDDGNLALNPNTIWYQDSDSDTFGNPSVSLTQCSQPMGYLLNSGDCDDTNPAINPNTVWYEDSDGDTYGNAAVTQTQCAQPTGYVSDNTDCDDGNVAIHPATIWYEDIDGDNFGDPSVTAIQCSQPPGFAINGGDNCLTVANPSQLDPDSDGIGSACDNCPFVANPGQEDANGDLVGDVCCCVGKVGDANGMGGDALSVGDITIIIEFLFGSGNALECLGEADVNMSGTLIDPPLNGGDITVADITVIIDHLFGSGAVLNDCP